MTTPIHTVGPVFFDSRPEDDEPAVLAQYDERERWNGFLCPHLDALSVVQILDWIGSDHEYGMEYHFEEDGVLVVHDVQYSDPESCDYQSDYEPDVYLPDEDGLYTLGGYSWTWTPVRED